MLRQYYEQVFLNIKQFKETKRFGFLTKSFILFLIAVIPGTLTLSALYLFLKAYFDLKSK